MAIRTAGISERKRKILRFRCLRYEGLGERIPEYLEAESLISSAKVLAATVVELPV